MKTLNMVKSPLLSLLVAITACDAEAVDIDHELTDDVEFRCLGVGCGNPLGNGPQVGMFPVGVHAEDYDEAAVNHGSELTILGGKVMHNGSWETVSRWLVTPNGMLKVYYFDSGQEEIELSGTDVIGLVWDAEVLDTTVAGSIPVEHKIALVDAACPAGMPCNYVFMTPSQSSGPERGMTTFYGPPLYPLCTTDDNDGSLSEQESISAVFAKNTLHELNPALNTLSVKADDAVNSLFCMNNAAGKSASQLGIQYNSTFDPITNSFADDATGNAMVMAVMAFAASVPQTSMGRKILVETTHSSLLNPVVPAALQLEGVYNGTDGLACKGPAEIHREHHNPAAEIPGYADIPTCPNDLSTLPASDAIAIWTVPAPEFF